MHHSADFILILINQISDCESVHPRHGHQAQPWVHQGAGSDLYRPNQEAGVHPAARLPGRKRHHDGHCLQPVHCSRAGRPVQAVQY